MADINLDDLVQALQQATDGLHRFNTETREAGVLSAARNQAQAQAAQEAQRRKALLKETSDNLKTFGNQLTGTLSSLTGGQTGFNQLGSVIGTAISAVGQLAGGIVGLIPGLGALGSAVSKLGEIAGKVAETAIQQIQVGFDAFKQAAKTGVVDSFTDLRDISGQLNFRMEELSGVLGSNSEKLAQLGGSALAGTNIFKGLASSSEALQRKFMRLGTDATELAGAQITLANQSVRYGMGMTAFKNVQEELLVNLEAESRILGKRKEDLLKDEDARMRESKFRGYQESLGDLDDSREQLKILMNYAKTMGPQVYESVKATFANRGKITPGPSQEGHVGLEGLPQEMFRTFDKTRSAMETIKLLHARAGELAAGMEPYTGTLPSEHAKIKFYPEMLDLSRRAMPNYQEMKGQVRLGMEGKTPEDKQLADAASDLRKSSINLQQGLTNISVVGPMLNFAAKAMSKLSEAVRDLIIQLGGKAPPGTPVATPETSMSFSDDASAIMQAAEQGQYEKEQAAKIKDLTRKAELERPKNAERLEQMVAKIKDSFPGAKITSTVRDYGDNLNSKHPLGRAIDFVIPDYDMSKTDEYMAKLRGLGFTEVLDEYIYKSKDKTGDHLHAAFKDGGITQGPSLAGEAGPEAVVPLPDGRTIPVNLGNSSELLTIWKRIESRLDALVSLTESSNYTQQKQLQYARS